MYTEYGPTHTVHIYAMLHCAMHTHTTYGVAQYRAMPCDAGVVHSSQLYAKYIVVSRTETAQHLLTHCSCCSCSFGVTTEARLVWQSTASAEVSFHKGRCAIPCMWIFCMCGWCVAICRNDSACVVSVRASCYIYIYSAQPRLQAPTPDRHRATQASKVIAGWCYGDPTQCAWPSICLLSDSQHSLQLRHSYSWV